MNTVDDSDLIPYICWKGEAKCCREGKVFLTAEEVMNIAQVLPLMQRKEFVGRLKQYTDFSIYDQKNRCQFLDADNFCQLQDKKLKPTECQWWPLHACVDNDKVVIRVSTCKCGELITAESEKVGIVNKEIQKIGEDRIRRFRRVYPGPSSTRSL